MREEMRLHQEMEAADLEQSGVGAPEAHRQAAIAFGGAERFKEEGRTARGLGLLDSGAQDLRYGWRMMRRRPGYTLTVALTLGLGVGATTAVFSLLDAVLLRPYPVERPDEVVAVYEALNARSPFGGTSYPTYLEYRTEGRSLGDLAAVSTLDVGLRAGERVAQVTAAVVSGNYFTLLGVPAALGRTVLPDDESMASASPVVVLSDLAWRRYFDADPAAIGRTVLLSGSPFTIIGVLPSSFRGIDLATAPALWAPVTEIRKLGAGGLYSLDDILTTRFLSWLTLVGRLPENQTAQAAAAELNTIAQRVRAAISRQSVFPRDTVTTPITVVPLVGSVAAAQRGELTLFLGLLGGIVVITLLVACANVASLTLTRVRERDREFGIRMAVGAGGSRLVRQLAVEVAMYAALGGLAALAIAWITRALLTSFVLPGGIVLDHLDIGFNPLVVLFASVMVGLATLMASLAPAIRASRRERGIELVGSGMAAPGRRRRLGPPLVAIQVGLSLVLLVVGMLFVRSLREALSTDLGFNTDSVVAATIGLRVAGYSEAHATQFLADLLNQPPGAPEVALATHVPLAPPRVRLPIAPEDSDSSVSAGVNVVSSGYFAMLGINLLEGALFGPTPDAEGAAQAVVNQAAAERLWPGQNPIGRRFQLMRRVGEFFTVVGVVETTKYHAVTDEVLPYVFIPMAVKRVGAHDQLHVLARAAQGPPQSALDHLRIQLRRQDPSLPIQNARLVRDQLDTVLMPQRFGSTLLGVFGLVALLISAVGIYGVVGHTVAVRTRELGIRAAVGASRGALASAVLRPTVTAVALGVVGGLAAASLLPGSIERYLYGVTSHDRTAFAAALGVLLFVALAAAWLPARRAARLNPLVAIRD
jgi:predicted permease